jgi:NHLM bacteriocin system secretion protein
MSTKIFRQVALERLSSPERLDQAYHVTRPKEWLALLAVFFLFAAAVVWGFEGSLATKITAQGVIIRRGGVVNIVASGSGLIVKVDVKTGDMVKSGQVLARIAQPGLSERIRIAQGAVTDAKRERERVLHVRNDSAKLQLDALARERSNAEREIETVRAQIKLASEEVPVNDELLSRGLITKQQSLAPKEKIVTLEGQIAAAQAHLKQIDSQTFTVKGQPEENDVDMHARVTDFERNLAALEKDFSTAANVVCPYDGKVLEVKVYRGSAVSEGTPIVSVQSAVEALEGLVYLSAFAAKDIKTGMEAQISPGTVRREEYGFMKGRVTFVADYPATTTAIMRVLENESLAQNIGAAGPVTEVRLELQPGPTASGFKWSSGKGPNLEITPGTLCSAQIVTRQERPITLVLPMLKDRLAP